MKLNWGHYLALTMLVFMIFILSFVYKTFTDSTYDHLLVSKEYYKDEINYQQEIDAKDNAKKLGVDVQLRSTNEGAYIIFPPNLNYKNMTGDLNFQRANDEKLDVKIPIHLKDNKMFIPNERLVRGYYSVKVDWFIDEKRYIYKEEFKY